MRHLYNRRSRRNLCEVRHPRITENVTDTGQRVGSGGIVVGRSMLAEINKLMPPEPVCSTCEIWWSEYRDMKTEELKKALKGRRSSFLNFLTTTKHW